ncbi:MAG TPA: AraC family transcriptional regulator [Streptosporangiaceae bacterium]|nr:AraC family transcriptional regulator [Streptosporangiaceae bacterium]
MTGEWSAYWRSGEHPLEAMHAHFERHTYHRHSHESYSFGVTDAGAQAFWCRGAAHTSALGMVMAFNPDDPHDGHASGPEGFTYRMIHIGPELIRDILTDIGGSPAGLPLFADPVVSDPVLAAELRALHSALVTRAPGLRRDELLTSVVAVLARRAASRSPRLEPGVPAGAAAIASLARQFIRERYASEITVSDLATAVGRSRYAIHRAFKTAYGIAPSDYQRQLRMAQARRLIACGTPISEAAAETGFADQSHLTRWFTRYYGITPGTYRRASSL